MNLYSGLGGNRELWTGCEVTSVELDPAIADVYRQMFPGDELVVCDALCYLEQNYDKYDFIWSSPPCPSHGQYRHNVGVLGKGYAPIIPDMTPLYGQIVFLQTYCSGMWVIENVKPYYEPLIKPTFEIQRHLFWSNFPVGALNLAGEHIRTKNKISDFANHEAVASSKIKNKRQCLRNRVNPNVGLHIFKEAQGYMNSNDRIRQATRQERMWV